MIGDVGNHLWQSTMVVAIAALVAFALRNNGAHVRHRIWLITSLKFLVPFSALAGVGGWMGGWAESSSTETSTIVTVAREASQAVDMVVEPFSPAAVTNADPLLSPTPLAADVGTVLLMVWAAGVIFVIAMRVRGWMQVRAALRSSTPLRLDDGIPIHSVHTLLEPGVVGIWKPVLLLPAGIEEQLSAAQLRAVLEHERCHIRRRDNLTAALHMVVEAVCWFHPAVWWVGARLVDERERACDEHVLRVCGEPEAYAEGILHVCKRYVESPLACVAGVSGADLKRRVTAIVSGQVGADLSMIRQTALAMAAVVLLSAPMLAGMVGGAEQAVQAAARFEAATVKPCDTDTPGPRPAAPPGFRSGGAPYAAFVSPGHVYWHCATLAQLIPQAYTSNEQPLQNTLTTLRMEDDQQPRYVKGGPGWLTKDRFTIEAKASTELTRVMLGDRESRSVMVLTPGLSHALRAVLEERFQLRVDRIASETGLFAMTVREGGLNAARIKPATAGDCVSTAEYSAWAETATLADRMGPARPRLCGQYYSGRDENGYYYEFSRVTLAFLATQLSRMLDTPVIDRTGRTDLFNFTIPQGTLDLRRGDPSERDSFYVRGMAELGLRLEPVRGQAESLVVKSVQPFAGRLEQP